MPCNHFWGCFARKWSHAAERTGLHGLGGFSIGVRGGVAGGLKKASKVFTEGRNKHVAKRERQARVESFEERF